MDEYGYVKDGQVFLKGYSQYPDRRIGEVKRTEQEAIDYFKNRFSIAVTKVGQLAEEIENAQNKGSYLTKLVQLRKKLLGFDGLGDFIPLLAKLDDLENYLGGLIDVNQKKNLEIKTALIEDVKALATGDAPDWQGATDLLQELKLKWIRTGPVEKTDELDIEADFQTLMDEFFQRRREHFSEQNRIVGERIARYDDIIEKTFALLRMYNVDEARLISKTMVDEWRTIGEIPPKKMAKMLKKYRVAQKKLGDKFNRVKGIVVEVREDPKVVQQRLMMVEAEKLSREQDIIMAADRAKVLLNQWKEIKLPPRTGDKMVAERFRAACDKIFELSYLARVLSRKYPALEIRSEEDQLVIKIREMEYLVKREKGDLEIAISDAQSMNADEETQRQVLGRINIQKRKIAMKEVILKEFQSRLSKIGE